MSLDGYIDDATPERLILSGDADWDRVDELRASADAILVGANTIRADNPRLRVRSEARRKDREARGLPANPLRVTLTSSGDIDPEAQFFVDDNYVVYQENHCPRWSKTSTAGRAAAHGGGRHVDPHRVPDRGARGRVAAGRGADLRG
ncbi:hypothetical protein GCM10029964_093750 [Kibdelosporangium lantanae]